MFGTKSKPKSKTNSNGTSNNGASGMNPQGGTCLIAKGTVIDGKLTSLEDLRVDGTITGDVVCQKRFVMGPSGVVKGSIQCLESNIQGRIEGEIRVNGRLHLHDTGVVEGKIVAKKLVVDEGASYNGECLIGDQHFGKG